MRGNEKVGEQRVEWRKGEGRRKKVKREFKERKMKRKKDVSIISAGVSSRNPQCRQAGHTHLAFET